MRLLIANDEGVHAPDLSMLAATLAEPFEFKVVAPEPDRRGSRHSLVYRLPRCRPI